MAKKAKKPKKVKTKKPKKERTSRGISQDRRLRSKEPHERGRGAPKKGNPRYKKARVKRKDGFWTSVFKLRKR